MSCTFTSGCLNTKTILPVNTPHRVFEVGERMREIEKRVGWEKEIYR